MEMRVAFAWSVLVIALGVFIAMLASVWRHQFHAPTAAKPDALVREYVWTTVPWIILAICVAPAVHEVLAAGRSEARSAGLAALWKGE